MAGRDMADPMSMISSIYAAIDIYNHRLQYDEMQEGRLQPGNAAQDRPQRGNVIE